MAKREKILRVGARVYFIREIEPGALVLWDGKIVRRPDSEHWTVRFEIGDDPIQQVLKGKDLFLSVEQGSRHLIYEASYRVERLIRSITRATGSLA